MHRSATAHVQCLIDLRPCLWNMEGDTTIEEVYKAAVHAGAAKRVSVEGNIGT